MSGEEMSLEWALHAVHLRQNSNHAMLIWWPSSMHADYLSKVFWTLLMLCKPGGMQVPEGNE